jgi:hypothetical protein
MIFMEACYHGSRGQLPTVMLVGRDSGSIQTSINMFGNDY